MTLLSPHPWQHPMESEMGIIRYCAEEVERQRDTPEHVYHMIDAWQWAIKQAVSYRWPSEIDVNILGHLVKPTRNPSDHFRQINVTVGWSMCPYYNLVPRMVAQWCAAVADGLDPDAAYKSFLEIHPFADGNGRTGKIVYNWIKGTLAHPVMPPNFWGCANP